VADDEPRAANGVLGAELLAPSGECGILGSTLVLGTKGGGMKHSAFTVLLPDRGLDEVFHLLSQLGYDGVELRVKEDYHVAPDQILSRVSGLKALMSRTGLGIPVLGTYLSVSDLGRLLPVFEAADHLRATGVRVSLGSPLDGTRSFREVLTEAQRGVEALVGATAPFRAKALFEIHFRTVISSPSLAYLLLKPFGPARVGVIWDPANMIIEGREDWALGLDLVGDYLGHVHVKNTAWCRNGRWAWRWEELDAGIVDWEEMIRTLSAHGYAGYLSNENLSGIVLPEATGFIGETLSQATGEATQPIEIKLGRDLVYLTDIERRVGNPGR
jgi:sugar phosphate isomerase/epimerase